MLYAAPVMLASLLILLWWWWRTKNLPPTPGLALPFIGHLHLFKPDLMDTINGWHHRLGDVFMIQMGWKRCVFLNGYHVISEAMLRNGESLLARPFSFLTDAIFNNRGISTLADEEWKEQRAFLHSSMRKLGVGSNVMADRIGTEIEHLLETIEAGKGEARDTRLLMMTALTNVMCGIVFGKRFDYEDESILFCLNTVLRLFQLMGASSTINVYPFLKYLPGDLFKDKEMRSLVAKLHATIKTWADKESRLVNVSDEAFEDLTQAYLTEIERKKLRNIEATSITEENLFGSSMSFFIGGSNTTAGTIQFAILFMIHHPDLQEKMYQEIKEIVGTDNAPKISHKPKLKFLTAFILETQRFGNLVSITVDRLSNKDIQLSGYAIPAGTSFFVNLDSVLFDRNVWGDPGNFRPSRFLNDAGDLMIPKEFIPFGLGKRNCPGEGIANMEAFLFISALVQRFEFRAEYENNLPTTETTVGFIRRCKSYKVRAISRTH